MIHLAEYPALKVEWLVRDSHGGFLMYLRANWAEIEELQEYMQITVDETLGVIHLK